MKKKLITDYLNLSSQPENDSDLKGITSNQDDSISKIDTSILSNCSTKNDENSIHNKYERYTRTPTSVHSETSVNDERYKFLVNVRDKNKNPVGHELYDPTTLYIPSSYYDKFTPFEKQFWDIKTEYYDTVIFFKKGKFYELYEDDAIIASTEFGLKITDRVNMKMAGVPESSFEFWSGKFLDKGYKIGKVDQAENMIGKNIREKENRDANVSITTKKEEKIIRRELKEVITQGTIYNNSFLKSALSIYIAVIRINEQGGGSILLYEASINRIYYESYNDGSEGRLNTIFAQNKIVEVISDCKLKLDPSVKIVKPIKGGSLIRFRDEFKNENEYQCFILLHNYMKYLKRDSFIDHVKINHLAENESNNMILDSITLKNLEILENNVDSGLENTLFDCLNFCQTNQGKRELKRCLIAPLKNIEHINNRRDILEIFDKINLSKIKESLSQFEDLERLISRLFSDNPSIKDLKKLIIFCEQSIALFENINLILLQTYGKDESEERVKRINLEDNDQKHDYSEDSCEISTNSIGEFKIYNQKTKCLYDILNESPDIQNILDTLKNKYQLKEDEIIPLNDDDIIHEYIRKLKKIERQLILFLDKQKVLLGDDSLCFKNIGKEIYQIEVKSTTEVPKEYFLVSSTKTTKRYYTQDLKMLINEYVECEERLFQAKGTILRRVVNEIKPYYNDFILISNIVARIDFFYSLTVFQKLAPQNICPEFTTDELSFKGLKNPVYKNFVGNDLVMDKHILILTGPNMGGKSTFLRSVCLNIILAQIGVKVFCEQMKTRLFDRIFTRIGANDNLLRGESTFMVELSETCKIIKNCTPDSFIVIDELGRGTSTKDGESIAWAVIEYLKRINVICMFSTHYQKMIEKIRDVKKVFMKVLISDDDIVFLYKINEGICYDSHGIEVAKLAKVPDEIIQRAKELRITIENKNQSKF